jgi:hypothetical protein
MGFFPATESRQREEPYRSIHRIFERLNTSGQNARRPQQVEARLSHLGLTTLLSLN